MLMAATRSRTCQLTRPTFRVSITLRIPIEPAYAQPPPGTYRVDRTNWDVRYPQKLVSVPMAKV